MAESFLIVGAVVGGFLLFAFVLESGVLRWARVAAWVLAGLAAMGLGLDALVRYGGVVGALGIFGMLFGGALVFVGIRSHHD